MDLQLLKDTKDGAKVFALILIVIGVTIFGLLLGMLLSLVFIDGDLMTSMESVARLATESDINLAKYYQIVTQFSMFILPALLFAFLIKKQIWSFFKMNEAPKLIFLGLGIVVLLLSNPFSEWLIHQNARINFPESLSFIEEWMKDSEEKAAFATNIFLDMKDWKDYAINILMIGILAAVGEELLFRGSLQPLLVRMVGNAHIAIWVTAFIFSAIHLQFYGFFARFFLGALLGYFYYYSNNLWIPILAHFFNNSMAVTYVYITKEPLYDPETLNMSGEETSPLYALLSLSMVILGVYLFRFYSRRQKIEPAG